MKGIENTKKEIPILKNDERMYVYLQGSHFQQNNVLTLNNDHVINKNVINIYIVYKLDPVASSRVFPCMVNTKQCFFHPFLNLIYE